MKVLAGTTIKIGSRIFYISSGTTLTWTDIDVGSEGGGKDYHIFVCDNSGTLALMGLINLTKLVMNGILYLDDNDSNSNSN